VAGVIAQREPSASSVQKALQLVRKRTFWTVTAGTISSSTPLFGYGKKSVSAITLIGVTRYGVVLGSVSSLQVDPVAAIRSPVYYAIWRYAKWHNG
jgi:hypothetical protein